MAHRLRAASWQALLRFKNQGKTRLVGVSNFTVSHLQALEVTTRELPSVNQVRRAGGE